MGLTSVVKSVCAAAGLNEWLVCRRRGDALVLNYHGVLNSRRADCASHVNDEDAASFQAQLQWLNRHFIPVNLSDFGRFWSGEWRPAKPPVLVTFDDGYRNNLKVAAPILRQQGVPATFFLAAGYIGTDKTLWNDEVRARVQQWPDAKILSPLGDERLVPPDTAGRRDLANSINRACKRLDAASLNSYLNWLREHTMQAQTMQDPEALAFMSWAEARELAALGFDIGSHTVHHPILSRLHQPAIAQELQESCATLQRELGRPCTAIAYPNGTHEDVNATVLEEVRKAGYEWAFMTTPTWAKPACSRYEIPRIGSPGHTDLATFKFYASGLHTRLKATA